MDILLENGDAVFTGKDLVITEGFENMPYLAWFGGNYKASTPVIANPNEQRFDWWANEVLFQNTPEFQMNSNLERLLYNTALNSTGRVRLEQVAISDIAFMDQFASTSVEVSLTGTDRIEISARIQELDNQESTEFVYIWDATQQRLDSPENIPPVIPEPGPDFSDEFSDDFAT